MEVAKAEVPDLPLAESVATLCRHKAAPGDLEHATPSGKKRANNLPSESNAKRPFSESLFSQVIEVEREKI